MSIRLQALHRRRQTDNLDKAIVTARKQVDKLWSVPVGDCNMRECVLAWSVWIFLSASTAHCSRLVQTVHIEPEVVASALS